VARILDISPTVSPRIGVWPGDVEFSREVALDLEKGDNLTLSALRTTVHLGAHADAPNHYAKGGAGIGARSLEPYLGPCQVVTAKVERGGRVTPDMLTGGEVLDFGEGTDTAQQDAVKRLERELSSARSQAADAMAEAAAAEAEVITLKAQLARAGAAPAAASADHAEAVYGPASRELVLPGRVAEKLLDALERPDHYRGVVADVRRHLAIHHSYDRRVDELINAMRD